MTASDFSRLSVDSHAATRAYSCCLQLAHTHYENFPVASRLIPATLRGPVAAIYAFARTADDVADEGHATAEQRLQQLQHYRDQLIRLRRGDNVVDPVLLAVAAASRQHHLPLQLFDDLLTAFMMDVNKTRYASFDEVLYYCRHSANPVGRLLLHLVNQASDINLRNSDDICTALQLINFLQDLEQDYIENDRIYIPEDELLAFGIEEYHFRQRRSDDNMVALIDSQIHRARQLLGRGAPLAWRLSGRFGLEIRLTVFGGLCILNKLQQQKNVFSRPRLSTRDKFNMVFSALFRQFPR